MDTAGDLLSRRASPATWRTPKNSQSLAKHTMGFMPKFKGGTKVTVCLRDHTEFHSSDTGGVPLQKAMREMRSLGGGVDGHRFPGPASYERWGGRQQQSPSELPGGENQEAIERVFPEGKRTKQGNSCPDTDSIKQCGDVCTSNLVSCDQKYLDN